MNDCAILGDEKVSTTALDFLEDGKPSPANARFAIQHANIPGTVANEGEVFCSKVGHNDFPGLAAG